MQDNFVINSDLKAQGSYAVASNCVLKKDNLGRPMVATGRELSEQGGGLLDMRLNIVSFDNTLDASEYLNYFDWLLNSSNQNLQATEFMAGRFVALLDNGFIPFYMPPTFFPSTLRDVFMNALLKSKVKPIEYVAMNFEGRQVHTPSRDIWVSRIEAAEFMGIPIEKVRAYNFIVEVLTKCGQ